MIEGFDFRHPDYDAVFRRRIDFLERIRAEPSCLPALKAHYRENPWDFIQDWGCTEDPRNLDVGRAALMPFVLFEKQVEWLKTVLRKWKAREPLLSEKSRDCGLSWLAVSFACTLGLFYAGAAFGFGSRKEELVDRADDPKSLFYKARRFMSFLPPEFNGGWNPRLHTSHMRLVIPETGSGLFGEAGDNIGRGGRTTLYFVDEAAFLERPLLADAALSANTNCRIDISSANGMSNPFYKKRASGLIEVFTFHWRDDPRKDEAWYAKQVRDLQNEVIVAQEIDIDYAASVEGVLIPSKWVQAAVDAHVILGIEPTGQTVIGLDVADEGQDKNAAAGVQGIVLRFLEQWSGKGSDLFATAQRGAGLCDQFGTDLLRYDSDGLGSSIRGDVRVINEERARQRRPLINAEPFRGSEAPVNPLGEDVRGRKNKDLFANRKAQAWWSLRLSFQETFRAVEAKREGQPFKIADPDALISIASDLPLRNLLMGELSQPTYSINGTGKILVDKRPDGVPSPNLADAVMIARARTKLRPMAIRPEALRSI